VSVVSTPKITGTPVSNPTAAMPCSISGLPPHHRELPGDLGVRVSSSCHLRF